MGRAWVRELRCVFPSPGSRRLNFQSGWKSAALGAHVAGVRWLGWSWQLKRVSADHFDRGLPDRGAFFADTFCPVCAVRCSSVGPPRAVATALPAQLPGSSSAGPGEATQWLWGLWGLRGLWGQHWCTALGHGELLPAHGSWAGGIARLCPGKRKDRDYGKHFPGQRGHRGWVAQGRALPVPRSSRGSREPG